MNCSLCNETIDEEDIIGVFKDTDKNNKNLYYFYHLTCLDDWTMEHIENIKNSKPPTINLESLSQKKQIKVIQKHRGDIEKQVRSREYMLIIDGEYICKFDYNGNGKKDFVNQLDKILSKDNTSKNSCCFCFFICFFCIFLIGIIAGAIILNDTIY